ncbi:MAG: hypothetical protein J3K34DRAFT_437413 [Monoraphidium minutum]|nr:MAG: hypothetical protein J3K34DRAFT_437413 [Monoraphidium minutum]
MIRRRRWPLAPPSCRQPTSPWLPGLGCARFMSHSPSFVISRHNCVCACLKAGERSEIATRERVMADFGQVGQLLGDAIDHSAAQAVQQNVQPAVQQATQAVQQSVVQAVAQALQPLHQTLTGLQQDVAGMRQDVAALQQDVQNLGTRQRNGVCCSGVGLGATPILWPLHSGGAVPPLIAGQPRPATRDAVQEAAAPVVDTMLSLYGLPAGPPAGGLPQRRMELLAHAGIYV